MTDFRLIISKIILLGITSKVCSAETSGNTDRTVTREDETKPPLLSAKRARLTVGSSGWLVSLMTVPLLPLWGAGGRGGILSGYGIIMKKRHFLPHPCLHWNMVQLFFTLVGKSCHEGV